MERWGRDGGLRVEDGGRLTVGLLSPASAGSDGAGRHQRKRRLSLRADHRLSFFALSSLFLQRRSRAVRSLFPTAISLEIATCCVSPCVLSRPRVARGFAPHLTFDPGRLQLSRPRCMFAEKPTFRPLFSRARVQNGSKMTLPPHRNPRGRPRCCPADGRGQLPSPPASARRS